MQDREGALLHKTISTLFVTGVEGEIITTPSPVFELKTPNKHTNLLTTKVLFLSHLKRKKNAARFGSFEPLNACYV